MPVALTPSALDKLWILTGCSCGACQEFDCSLPKLGSTNNKPEAKSCCCSLAPDYQHTMQVFHRQILYFFHTPPFPYTPRPQHSSEATATRLSSALQDGLHCLRPFPGSVKVQMDPDF